MSKTSTTFKLVFMLLMLFSMGAFASATTMNYTLPNEAVSVILDDTAHDNYSIYGIIVNNPENETIYVRVDSQGDERIVGICDFSCTIELDWITLGDIIDIRRPNGSIMLRAPALYQPPPPIPIINITNVTEPVPLEALINVLVDTEVITITYQSNDFVYTPVYRLAGSSVEYVAAHTVTLNRSALDIETNITFYDGFTILDSIILHEKDRTKQVYINSSLDIYPVDGDEIYTINITEIRDETRYEKTLLEQLRDFFAPREGTSIESVAIYDETRTSVDVTTVIENGSVYIQTENELEPGHYTAVVRSTHEGRTYVDSISLAVNGIELASGYARIKDRWYNDSLFNISTSENITFATSERIINETLLEVIPQEGSITELLVNTNVSAIQENKLGLETDIELGEHPENLEWKQTYAIDPTQSNVTTITLSAVAKGTALYKCALWNFSAQTCYGEWKYLRSIVPGEAYNITIDAKDPAFGEASPYLKMEWGEVTNLNDTWQTVNTVYNYSRPVIVATPHYTTQGVATVPRITNITQGSFRIRLQDTNAGTATTRDTYYLVVEEGAWQLPNGQNIEAASYISTQTDHDADWSPVQYSHQLTYTTPVVLGQVMSYNDTDWSVFWSSDGSQTGNPTNGNIWTGKHVGEDPSTTRDNEEIGIIVIEQNSGNLTDVEYSAYISADAIQGVTTGGGPQWDVAHPITFENTPSIALAATNGMDGGNGGWPVVYGAGSITTTQIGMSYDEYNDGERAHTAEPAGLFVFETAGSYDGNEAPEFISPAFNETVVEPLTDVIFSVNITDPNGNTTVTSAQATFRYPNGTLFNGSLTQQTVGDPTETGDLETGTRTLNGSLFSAVGETGTISDVSTWQTVTIEKPNYVDPVVFAFTLNQSDRGPREEEAIALVTNVTGTSFRVAVFNASQQFITDDVGYVVMEKGVWNISNETVQVGTWDYSGTAFVTRSFNETFNNAPTFYMQIQDNTNDWYVGRYDDGTLTTSSANIQFEDQNNAFSGSVTVAYIAFEQGVTTDFFAGNLEAAIADDPGTGTFRTVNFPQAYDPPVFMGLVSDQGGDPTKLGTGSLTPNSVDIRPTEETETDPEQNHATNDALWMVFNSSIFLENITTQIYEDISLSPIEYTDIDSAPYDFISEITITVDIDTYENTGSTAAASTDPRLRIYLNSDSGYINIGTVSGTGNRSRTTFSQTIAGPWASTASYRDIRIVPEEMDKYNDTHYDTISWSNVYATIQAGNRTVVWRYLFTDTGTVGIYNMTQLQATDGDLTNITNYTSVSFEVRDQTPPTITDIYNITVGDTQELIADFDATDYSGIKAWDVNNTNFTINASGTLFNATNLSVGIYLLNVSVNDTYDNVAWDIVRVNVTNVPDTREPDFTPPLTIITVPYAEEWSYDINATDDRGIIGEYWVNDTVNFIINSDNGNLSNNTFLSLGIYMVNVSVNDSSNNINTSTLIVNVTDQTPPEFNIPAVITVEFGRVVSENLDITDNVAIDTITVNDTNVSVNNSGYFTNITALARGNYSYNITANDTAGNVNSTSFILEVVDTTEPDAITNLNATAKGYDWIYWNWTAPSDVDLAGYILYLDGSPLTNTTQTNINVTGLVPSTTYNFTVETYDNDGNINTSNVSILNATLINNPGAISIITPLNLTAGLEQYRVVNFSVTDQEESTFCVTVLGSDQSPPSQEHQIYRNCSYTNATDVIFNWSAPTLTRTGDAEVLWHFDTNDVYGETATLVNDFGTGSTEHDITCSGGTCPDVTENGYFGGAFDYDPTASEEWTMTEQFFNDAFSARSYQLWFKADDTASQRYIYEEGGNTNGLGFKIESNLLQAAVRTSNIQFTLTTPFTDTNDWHMLVVQYDNGNFSMYLDGVLVDSDDTSASYTTVAGHGDEAGLGGPNGGGAFGTETGTFDGQIDEFRITTNVLTPENISSLYSLNENTTYYWAVQAEDPYNTASSGQTQFTVEAPQSDLTIVNISYTTPIEGTNATVTALVNNTGTLTANNVLVEFIIDNVTSINRTIPTINPGVLTEVNISYLFDLGTHNINVTVDANASISEANETNNNASTLLFASSWFTIYGTTGLDLLLGTDTTTRVYEWFSSDTTGTMFITDSDAVINFASLYALGRNISLENSTNDFTEADTTLNMTSKFDSLLVRYASDPSTPRTTKSFDVNTTPVLNVPIINSTNSSTFTTGILWDSSSDSTGEYDENETLIFVTDVLNNVAGRYGTYDFEITIPTTLGRQTGGTTSSAIYLEIN